MTAVAFRIEGLQRMSTGFSLFCQAMIDAGQGLYSMLSGAALLVAATLLTLWAWICLPFVSLFPKGPPRALSWRWFRFPGLHFLKAVVRWVAWALVAVLVVAGIDAVIDGIGPAVREALPDARSFLLPLAVFATLAVVVLVAFLTIRLGAPLIASLGRFLTRQGVYALAAFLVVMLAGAAGVVLYAVFQPSLVVIALISGLALLAGFAGIALVSFGPSGFSMFRFGGQGATSGAYSRRASRSRPSSSTSRQSTSLSMQLRAAIGSRVQRLAARSIASANGRAMARLPALPRPGVAGDRRLRSWPALPQRLIFIALLAVLALLLGWFGGSLLLRMFPASSAPLASTSKPAAPHLGASVSAAPLAVGPQVVQLVADGIPADVSWRLGYRSLTVRLDDGAMVSKLTLPETACTAGAIIVFGAASSDGAAARNQVLAEQRTRWLADWAAKSLSQCANRAPVVIAASLGQARQGLPLPDQRAVRVLAIQDEELGSLAISNDPQKLLNMGRGSFGSLDDFASIKACTMPSPEGELPRQGLPRACEADEQ